MDGADVVASVCLVVGVIVLGLGCFVGLTTKVAGAAKDAKDKVEDAKAKLDDAQRQIVSVHGNFAVMANGGGGERAEAATSEAAARTAEAKSALEEVGSIIGSLPEALRFAGLLVLVGTVLIGVATIQFGGTSLF